MEPAEVGPRRYLVHPRGGSPVQGPVRSLAVGAVLALLLQAAPSFGGSALPEGATAPAFEGKEFINTEEVSMNDLRGRVIFLELFRSW